MHKLDDIFAQPKAVCYFQLVSPVPVESPRTWAALTLFELCLDEHLNEYTYDARVRTPTPDMVLYTGILPQNAPNKFCVFSELVRRA